MPWVPYGYAQQAYETAWFRVKPPCPLLPWTFHVPIGFDKRREKWCPLYRVLAGVPLRLMILSTAHFRETIPRPSGHHGCIWNAPQKLHNSLMQAYGGVKGQERVENSPQDCGI
ncbi:hypothetical protein FKP32DRAFT_1599984 [Trametes sanguinea]|nr:hypothetical protein FKP32DRAFT_1599984 [Trametes sanguinea]